MTLTEAEAGYLPDNPHVAVIGAGALGILYGARLAMAGVGVSFITGSAVSRAALLASGIELCEGDGCDKITGVNVFASLADAPAPDVALVMVKSPDTRSAINAAAPYIPEHCPVLTMQNGLNNVEAIAAVLGPERVLAGVSYNGATRLAPGRVRHAGRGDTVIGELSGAVGGRVASVAALIEKAGLPCTVSGNIKGLIWEKLMVNVAINPVAALTRRTNGELAEHEDAVAIMGGLVAEAVAVAASVGVELDAKSCMDRVLSVARATAANRASMLQDVLAGRVTEIMHINGAVAVLGEAAGVPCPLNRTVAGLVRLLEAGGPGG